MIKGEITAFLSLIFLLLMSFTAGMLEAASVQNAKNYRRADTCYAAECVFAEYQKELLEEYDIFSFDGGYGSGEYRKQNVLDRFSYYGAGGIDHTVQKIQFLTDNGGQSFLEQAVLYMEHKYGIHFLEDKLSMTDTWKVQEDKGRKYERKLQEDPGEEMRQLPAEDNPIAHISQLQREAFLELIVPPDMQISDKKADRKDWLSERSLNKGYGNFQEESQSAGALRSLLFGEYLLEHFSMATDEKAEGVLDYELEYICAGKNSDRENLEDVAKKLFLLRFASNYSYLQTSASKKAEAEALALTLCTLAAVPGLEKLAMQAILLAWAAGESVMDIRSLLGKSRVPLVKNDGSWQLSLSGLMRLGAGEKWNDGKDSKDGLEYREYLRILLFLQKKETTAMRALEVMEQNIRYRENVPSFHADFCISRLQLRSRVRLQRGITYTFQTYYGYR